MKLSSIFVLVTCSLMLALTGCQSTKNKTKKQISTSVKPVKAKSKRSKRSDRKVKSSNNARRLVAQYAGIYGVNKRLASAVSYRESTHRCHLRGRHTEIGPLQIKPRSARFLGCTSKQCQRSLRKSCKTQVKYGMIHLAAAQRRARRSCSKKNLLRCAAFFHNRGIFAKTLKNKSGRAYADRVMASYRRGQ